MFISYKNLLAISAAALAMIALALAIRISKDLPKPFPAAFDRLIEQGESKPSTSFYDSGSKQTEPNKTAASAIPGIPVSAAAYLVGNVKTGEIYLQKNSSAVLPVASMSKLITAVAAIDTIAAGTKITISQENLSVASDTSMLMAGERFSRDELLYPMLLSSSNIAAEAFASVNNRAHFLELMSSYAWEIGMPSTFFADPSGIDPHNESSAKDFFALARYLYTERRDILAITRTPAAAAATTTDHNAHQFTNIHPFVNDPDFLGGKTGHTPEAGDTMLTIMNINGQPIAIVVLASDGRAEDTRVLISAVKKVLAAN
jgi:D-alanyl-D-alanine endopeptidase (penicillin-binding protein 7)